MSLTFVEYQYFRRYFKIVKLGINPLNPISTTFSPAEGSNFPSALTSLHSKLLLIDN